MQSCHGPKVLYFVSRRGRLNRDGPVFVCSVHRRTPLASVGAAIGRPNPRRSGKPPLCKGRCRRSRRRDCQAAKPKQTRHCEPVRTLAWQSRGSSESLYRGGRRCPPDLRPHSFLSLLRKRKESPRRQKKPAPFRFRRGGENSISAAFFFLSESRPLRWVAFRLILEKKENVRNREHSRPIHRLVGADDSLGP